MQRILLTLALGGLASLAVASPPAVDVNVTNPVLAVEVSNADPIPVTDVAAAGRTPFSQVISREFTEAGSDVGLTVPAGTRAVFKHVSGLCVSASPTFSFVRLLWGQSFSQYVMYLAPQFVREASGATYYTFNHATDVAMEPDVGDRTVRIAGLFAGTPVSGSCQAIVNGYFE
jgi:hypothetical protein